ncbi:Resolvase, N terminal domain/Recombinase zinc beta ribbon domain/Recombinase [Dehalogenimonas alkenigignens]|uniref:Resolvase, N terminal domain/Recombinase zinc beta ribbon domain/Recombinase n=1 Tax=Dehalogenimonas alkenigignens TaxID=1217799 RepID=A0A0W0GJX6_9CHLR|nr:Resolvase, N terminal domain/Recombinase zinc beta ribbon domain/Recombinase [Dehalogenimonas alkenigignens]
MTEAKRAVTYIRVSDVSQVQGHSLTAQERLFRELCQNRGWQPVGVYREEGKSAHVDAIAKRPVFRQLLEDASKHQFDVIVIHTLDRWSRNMKVTIESLSILAKHHVGLVSITESIDYSTPEGMLSMHMLGAFNQFFSSSLAKHVKKGQEQRIYEGKHHGAIPFGYQSCWDSSKGEKVKQCDPEHSGGIHIHPTEGPAVTELFRRYASGTGTLSSLAGWLNAEGFRTRNTKASPDAIGNLVAGPRLFTTASIRGILHNPFFTGQVVYQGKALPGAHQPLISKEVFIAVQDLLKKNSGRSETLSSHPEREYLLKGLVRCAYCGMPMWAQTYTSGNSYYREHKATRSIEDCRGHGGAITCSTIDNQVRELVSAIELGPKWLEEVLSIISLKDDVERIKKERDEVKARLLRLGRAYVDNVMPEEEYKRQKRLLELSLESLVVPDYNAAEAAGKLILDLPKLWASATLSEQRKILLTILDAVYIDAKAGKRVIAVMPKPPFRPIFQVASAKKDSKIHIINEPLGASPKGSAVFLVETGESRTPRPMETARNVLQV